MAYSSPSLMQYRPLISLSLSTFSQASKLQSSPWKLAGELKKIIKAYRVMQSLCTATHWVLALGSLQVQSNPARCKQRSSRCSAGIQTQICAVLDPISLSSHLLIVPRSPWWNSRLIDSDSLSYLSIGISCFHASLISSVLMHDTWLHPLQWLIPKVQACASWENTPLQFQRELQGWGLSGIRPWTCSFFLWGMKCPRRFGILGSLLLLIHNAFCYWPIVTNSRFFFRKISMVIWACWHQLVFFLVWI